MGTALFTTGSLRICPLLTAAVLAGTKQLAVGGTLAVLGAFDGWKIVFGAYLRTDISFCCAGGLQYCCRAFETVLQLRMLMALDILFHGSLKT
jgi:hypothetical protein